MYGKMGRRFKRIGRKMKIIFPTNDSNGLESSRSSHFGKANFYTLVNVEGDKIGKVKSIKNQKDEGHSCGGAAQAILSQDVDVLVVGGIGPRPAKIFAQEGLDLYMDKGSKTVKESLELFLADKLNLLSGDDACGSHH